MKSLRQWWRLLTRGASEESGGSHELPRHIAELIVPESILVASDRLIASFRERQVEGALLWYGYCFAGDRCVVTTCVRPEQVNTPGSYSISADSMRAVRRQLRPHALLLLVQIHTHPEMAYFSGGDAEHALNKQVGALNLVAPNFGHADWQTCKDFAMVERTPNGKWRPWVKEDWKRLRVVPTEMNLSRYGTAAYGSPR